MDFAAWSIVVGLLLIVLALSGTVLERLPLSTAMSTWMAGLAVSPLGMHLLHADLHKHTVPLERLTEWWCWCRCHRGPAARA
jgi:NhaP-type Na+/H+ or K+/H+ antiporter